MKKKEVNKIKGQKNLEGNYSDAHDWVEELVSCDFEDYMDDFTAK